MVNKKVRRHSGYSTPNSVVPIKFLKEKTSELFISETYNDWNDWRDSMRDFSDRTLLKKGTIFKHADVIIERDAQKIKKELLIRKEMKRKMAQFCSECGPKEIGKDFKEKGWYCGPNGLCEGCGYQYLKNRMKKEELERKNKEA